MKNTLIRKIQNNFFLPPKLRRKLLDFLESGKATETACWMLEKALDFHTETFKKGLSRNMTKDKYKKFEIFSKGLTGKIFIGKEKETIKADKHELETLTDKLNEL